jgi:hypothetical protein
MARPMFTRMVREILGDTLVEDHQTRAMADALAGWHYTPNLRWHRIDRSHILETGYGVLRADPYFATFWTVTRDSAPLIRIANARRAVFQGLRGAQAAALIHVADGFNNKPPIDDGLRWDMDR